MCKAIAVISILRDFVAFTTKGVGRSYLFYAPMALKSKTGVRRRETGDRLPTPDFRPGAKKYPISNNQYSISNMVGMGGIPNRSRQTGISAEFIPQSGAPVTGTRTFRKITICVNLCNLWMENRSFCPQITQIYADASRQAYIPSCRNVQPGTLARRLRRMEPTMSAEVRSIRKVCAEGEGGPEPLQNLRNKNRISNIE